MVKYINRNEQKNQCIICNFKKNKSQCQPCMIHIRGFFFTIFFLISSYFSPFLFQGKKTTSTSPQPYTNIMNYSSHSRKFPGYMSSVWAMPRRDGSGQAEFKLISHTRRYLLKRTTAPHPLALHSKCLFPAHFWQVFTAWAISRSPGHFLQKLFSKTCKGQGMMRHYSHCKGPWKTQIKPFSTPQIHITIKLRKHC